MASLSPDTQTVAMAGGRGFCGKGATPGVLNLLTGVALNGTDVVAETL